MLKAYFPNVDWNIMWEATQQTLFMSSISVGITLVLGLILGMLLFLTAQGNLLQNKPIYALVSVFVNVFRSIPFIILIVLLIPFTDFLIGTMIGDAAALPALIIGAAPFYARMVEIALREIDKGVIEASEAMGASTLQIILKVLIPESLPALISGITVTSIAIVGYTAMAGFVGAGGLGNLAYMEGFQRSKDDVTFVATVIVLILVFVIQFIGNSITNKIDKR
ncbi:MAG: methionine transporter permease [Bacillales bacterium]|jgi:D-methionine transport system permease protein|nr:methionine transporter permease [Bacillales bacterium]